MTEFDSEVISRLKAKISGRCEVHTDGEFVFQALRRCFPVHTSGIDWENVPEHISFSDYDDSTMLVNQVRKAFDAFCSATKLSPKDEVNIVGDLVTDFALRLSVKDTQSILDELIALPQTTVITTTDFRWCFAVTISGDIRFGAASRTGDV